MDLQFEWDEVKAADNLQKHGVSFEEATTVFSDPVSVTAYDAAHSVYEDRYIDIGFSLQGRLLVVVYSERDVSIRIISCRRATPVERRQYEQRTP